MSISEKNSSPKSKDLITYGVIAAVLIMLNIIGSQFFFRLDMTEEKRFSLSQSTKSILENLEEEIYVEVFLDGELPKDFKRLRQTVKETLDEFRIYSEAGLNYKFINPLEDESQAQKKEVFQHLVDRGLRPTTLYVNEGDQRTEKVVFPSAIIHYLEKEIPVSFLTGDPSSPPQVQLNQSIENLEFQLISSIKKMSNRNPKKIGFLQGHGELGPVEAGDFLQSAGEMYDIRRVRLQSSVAGEFEGLVNLLDFDALIIAKPDSTFSEEDKFKLDQYVVKGGKLMIFVDGMFAEIDSIGEKGMASTGTNLNLDDLFFKWGIRVNRNLIQDQFSAAIPLVVGYMGNRPQYQMMKWPYYPILNEFGNHPVSRNSQPIYSKFLSSLDTVSAQGIKKTPLIWTSDQTRAMPSPVFLDFNEVRKPTPTELFNKGNLMVSILLEGTFSSVFEGRVSDQTASTFDFKEKDRSSQIIVFSDGDIIRNDINGKTGTPYLLGYDKFSKVTFGNKPFILNSLDYLLDDVGIIEARNKRVILRPLNPKKIKADRRTYQILNIAAPLLLLMIVGVLMNVLRRKKYS